MELKMDQAAASLDVTHGHQPTKVTDSGDSEGRADFMKRFFSVAVSVGFASKIGDLKFLSSLSIPTMEQAHQIILLVFAMVVVVGSWEFYFGSVKQRPLVDLPRFVVDIIIVSLYIILLLSVKSFDVFFFYLLVIMFSYIVWDILSMRVYPAQYGVSKFTASGVFNVYKNGAMDFSGKSGVGKIGPFITAWWFIIFCALFAFHLRFPTLFYPTSAASFLGYIFYRRDQSRHWPIFCRCTASALIFVFLIATSAFG